jgi:hypothetical protein
VSRGGVGGGLDGILLSQGLGVQRLWLCISVGRGARDALLLAAPGVIVGGVTDVVVDEGVCLLLPAPVLIHLVLAVAALESDKKEKWF